MSNAFVCFRGGKPLNITCRDSATSGMATASEQQQWKRDHATLRKFAENDSAAKISSGLSSRMGLIDRGTVTKEADLEYTSRAPDGMRAWTHNKDFVRYERRRGNPVAVANPTLELSTKDG